MYIVSSALVVYLDNHGEISRKGKGCGGDISGGLGFLGVWDGWWDYGGKHLEREWERWVKR